MTTRVAHEPPRASEPFTFIGFDTDEPVVAVSLHSGHAVRPELVTAMALPQADRTREEDTAIDRLATVTRARALVYASRFEVDLNRPPDRAVYRTPEEAWGLRVWRRSPSEAMLAGSLRIHHAFYSQMGQALERLRTRFGRFVVLDLHSYNHRRNGPSSPPAKPHGAPEINLGTQSVNREAWGPFIDRFAAELRCGTASAHGLDVRENVKFFGGYFPRWVNARFGRLGCAIALEFKKTYMDEWSGAVDYARLEELRLALRRALNASLRLLEEPS